MQFIVQQCTRAATVAARAGMTRDERVIEHIREHPGATQKQIRAAVGCSEERITDALKRLTEDGQLEMRQEKFYGRMVKRYYPIND